MKLFIWYYLEASKIERCFLKNYVVENEIKEFGAACYEPPFSKR